MPSQFSARESIDGKEDSGEGRPYVSMILVLRSMDKLVGDEGTEPVFNLVGQLFDGQRYVR
jgi:hypothetical protein